MKYLLCVVILFCVIISATIVSGGKSKYSKDANEVSERTYRSKKARLIWEKALRTLKGQDSKLDELKIELKVIDEELINLKHLKHENKDPYGDVENSIERKVEDLLERYGMVGKFDNPEKTRTNKLEDLVQQENELSSILDKARKLGFSDDDMTDLHQEIGHHKRKMKELDVLLGQFKETKDQLMAGKTDEGQSKEAKEKLIELKSAVKEKQRDLEHNMNRLSIMSEIPSSAKNSSFTRPKVIKLWADVLRSNFTEEERESLKEELMHLEKKMIKREHVTDQVELVKKHGAEAKRFGTPQDTEKAMKKHKDLLEKADNLNRHVKKYEKELQSRISSRGHTEL